jgi:hypothetical protein
MVLNSARLAAAFIGLSMLGACASQTTVAPSRFSGYLEFEEYQKLQPGRTASGAEVLRWRDERFSARHYDAIIVDPVVLYPSPDPESPPTAGPLEEMRIFLTAQLREKIAAVIPVTETPRLRVARLNVALTGVDIAGGSRSESELLHAALIGNAWGRDVEIYLEAKVKDSISGRYLLTSVREIRARPRTDVPIRNAIAEELRIVAEDAQAGVLNLGSSER